MDEQEAKQPVEEGKDAAPVKQEEPQAKGDNAPKDDHSADVFSPGEIINGSYKIVNLIGRGGMGEVYRAKNVELGIDVALKVVSKAFSKENSHALDMLRNEAKKSASLRHKNIVSVLELKHELRKDVWCLVMEYIDGGSLHSILDRQKVISEEQSIVIVQEIANALNVAADLKIAHRDIKPDNILFTSRGEVKLADLGIARHYGSSGNATKTAIGGFTAGTPEYLAPEQLIDSENYDIRSDIYSLGVSFYEMITGHLPFDKKMPELAGQIISELPPDPREFNQQISEWCAKLVLRMLEKNPENRFNTPKELIEAIDAGPYTFNILEREEMLSKLVAGEHATVIDSRTSWSSSKYKRDGSSLIFKISMIVMVVSLALLIALARLWYKEYNDNIETKSKERNAKFEPMPVAPPETKNVTDGDDNSGQDEAVGNMQGGEQNLSDDTSGIESGTSETSTEESTDEAAAKANNDASEKTVGEETEKTVGEGNEKTDVEGNEKTVGEATETQADNPKPLEEKVKADDKVAEFKKSLDEELDSAEKQIVNLLKADDVSGIAEAKKLAEEAKNRLDELTETFRNLTNEGVIDDELKKDVDGKLNGRLAELAVAIAVKQWHSDALEKVAGVKEELKSCETVLRELTTISADIEKKIGKSLAMDEKVRTVQGKVNKLADGVKTRIATIRKNILDVFIKNANQKLKAAKEKAASIFDADSEKRVEEARDAVLTMTGEIKKGADFGFQLTAEEKETVKTKLVDSGSLEDDVKSAAIVRNAYLKAREEFEKLMKSTDLEELNAGVTSVEKLKNNAETESKRMASLADKAKKRIDEMGEWATAIVGREAKVREIAEQGGQDIERCERLLSELKNSRKTSSFMWIDEGVKENSFERLDNALTAMKDAVNAADEETWKRKRQEFDALHGVLIKLSSKEFALEPEELLEGPLARININGFCKKLDELTEAVKSCEPEIHHEILESLFDKLNSFENRLKIKAKTQEARRKYEEVSGKLKPLESELDAKLKKRF